MDFSNLDLREAASKEYWVHLRLDDTLLFAGKDKPCRVKTASAASPEVEEALKAVTRVGALSTNIEGQLALAANRQKRRAIEGKIDEVERDAERALTRFLCTAIVDWENIEKDGKSLPFSKEALSDYSQPKAPLFRLAVTLAEDMREAQSPFAEAESD